MFQSSLGGILLSSGGFTITDNLTINGPGASLTISGNNAQRIFTINSGVTATFSALKLQNGGIQNSGTLTLNNSTIQSSIWGSASIAGGAIGNTGTMVVNNCTLSGNSATDNYGGGIYNAGTLTVNSSVLSGNTAPNWSGGGIYNTGTLTVNNSTVSGNSTDGSGGGIRNGGRSATATVNNTTLSGNSAQYGGGGINHESGTLTVRNSTLSGNSVLDSSTSSGGGGISIRGSATILNSTLSGNAASASRGGGIHISRASLSIGNTLVAGNTGFNGKEIYNTSGVFTSLGDNLFGENGTSGLVNVNPIASDIILPGPISTAIGPLANNGGPTLTHLPVAGSPLINAGNNTLAQSAGLTTDQRGFGPRIVNGTVDIGSVEVGAVSTIAALVTHYYQFILGRAPDTGGLAYWQGEIARLQGLGVDVQEAFRVMAGQFFTSAEYLDRNTSNTQYVTDLYRTFFNRTPDSGGLSYWAGQLAAGMPRGMALYSFLFSAEFGSYMQARLGNTTSRGEVYAVVDFYRGFLNRLPDSGGFGYWIGRFRTAQCQGVAAVNAEVESISRQFAASTEYFNRNRDNRNYVADLYYAFLRRGGELTGFSFWVSQLNTGVQTRDQVRRSFLQSPEFQGRVQQIINQGCLN
ncbi:MAG TPA: DUF4214 domain-containing protein [Xanthomonadaceae bacterium]|nr:DUF4214 domain-containing protein [Xanthomonadaceae bacterium]